MESKDHKPVILYDGVCNFCNVIVNFVLEKDNSNVFLCGPIQSKEARALLRSHNENFANLKTVYLLKNGVIYKRSKAIFQIFKDLPHPYKVLYLFNLLPVFLTDAIYKYVAKNRYKWFGKQEEVVVPNENKERFIHLKP